MEKRLLIVALVVATAAVLFIGCASIIHGTKQEVLFETSPAGATVQVTGATGVHYGPCETPCSLELHRKREYQVTLTKDGYGPAEFHLERKSDGWIWGNILLGGVIGLIVDFSNGAAYKLSPEQVQVTLSESSSSELLGDLSGDKLVFIDFESLSAVEQDRLRSLDGILVTRLWQ